MGGFGQALPNLAGAQSDQPVGALLGLDDEALRRAIMTGQYLGMQPEFQPSRDQRPPPWREPVEPFMRGQAGKVVSGAKELAAEPTAPKDSSPQAVREGYEQMWERKRNAAADVAEGVSALGAGFGGPALVASPLVGLAGLAGSVAGGYGAEKGAEKLGLSPGAARLAGIGGGYLGGAGAGVLAGEIPQTAEAIGRAYRESPLAEERGSWSWKPGTKLAQIPENVEISRAGNRLTIHDLGAYFNERVGKTLGQIPADAPPSRKLNRILKVAIPEFEDQLSQPDPKLDFYTKDAAQADADIIQAYPELARNPSKLIIEKAISAASSPANEPIDEAEIGGRIYGIYKDTGKLPLMQPSGKNWPGQNPKMAMAQLQRYLDSFGPGAQGERGLAKFLMSKHTIKELRKLNPNVGGKADDVAYGSLILGPKVGNYFNDLAGLPQEGSTIDRWEVRGNQRRLGDTLRDGKLIDSPLSRSDRDVFMELHRVLGDRYKLTRNQAQSGSWHYEKGLYTRLGVNSPPSGRSEGTLRLLESMGKIRPPDPNVKPTGTSLRLLQEGKPRPRP